MRALAAALFVLFAASGCAGSGAKPSTQYTTSPETTAGVSLESPRVQQIALARSSNDLFSIFPAKPGSKNCPIPAGGLHFKPLRGVCTTSIHAAQTHEPELIVSFTETWGTPPCRRGLECMLQRTFHHTWRVLLTEPIGTPGARLRIAATQQSGATAPQYWR